MTVVDAHPDPPGSWGTRGVSVRRVRKAYEQVADELRSLITSGKLATDERLPPEAALAQEFGVSRATVREALRVLVTQNLVRTTKGSRGGTYVTLPTVDHLSDFMTSNLHLMTEAESVTLDEFLEARRVIEVAAARMAAERADETILHRLRASIPDERSDLEVDERYRYDREFHSIIVEGCGNALLYIAAQPIFVILQDNLERSPSWRTVQNSIGDQHERVARAIVAGDVAGAEREMSSHMDFLAGVYAKIWRGRNARQPPAPRRTA